MIHNITPPLLALLAVACAPTPTDITSSSDSYSDITSQSTISIAALKNLYIDGSHSINKTVSVTGSITANDLYGEYPESLVVQDSSGAIEIKVDLEGSLHQYSIGTTITLYCSDIWIASNGGTIYLGDEPTADDIVDTLSLSDFERRLLDVNSDSDILSPLRTTIAELSTSLISTYIYIEGLTLLDDGGDRSFCTYDEESGCRLSTTHTLVDGDGSDIELFVASTVIYAEESIPTGELTLYGILYGYYGNYSLRLVERRITAK